MAQDAVDDTPGISAKDIADRLADQFGEAPAPTTIRDWLRTGVLVVGDYWMVARASADEARLVLPAIAFLITKGRPLPRLTITRAKWIAKLRAIDPDMPAGSAVVLARLYEAYEASNGDMHEVDRYLATADWSEWGDDGSRPPVDRVWLSKAWRAASNG